MTHKLKGDESFMVLVLFWDEYWTLRRRQNSKCWFGVNQILEEYHSKFNYNAVILNL